MKTKIPPPPPLRRARTNVVVEQIESKKGDNAASIKSEQNYFDIQQVDTRKTEPAPTKESFRRWEDKESIAEASDPTSDFTVEETPENEDMDDVDDSPSEVKSQPAIALATLNRGTIQEEAKGTPIVESRRPSNTNDGKPLDQPQKLVSPRQEYESARRSSSSTYRTSLENTEIVAESPRQNQQQQQTLQGTFSTPRTYRQTSQAVPEQHEGQNRYYQQPPHAQRRPDQYRDPPPRSSPQQQQQQRMASRGSSPTSKFFKSVWGNVEKGLDELANIEGSITRRAERLVSSAASYTSVSSAVSSASKILSSKPNDSNQSKRQIPTRTKQEEAAAKAAANASPFAHLGQKYKAVQTQRQTNPDVTSKLIRANGGASAPYGQTPSQPALSTQMDPRGQAPASPQPPSEQSQRPPQQPGPVEQGNDQSNQSHSYGSNPYTQSGQLQRQLPQKKIDPHSRESRIPWETSPSKTPRPSQNQPRSVGRFEEESTSWKEKISGLIPRVRVPNPAKLFRFRRTKSYQYASMDAWNDDDEDSRRGFFGLFRRKKSNPSSVTRLSTSSSQGSSSGETMTPPLASLMNRSKNAKTTSLLAESDEKKSRSMGRFHAAFDFAFVMFLVLGMQQLPGLDSLAVATSLAEFTSETLPNIASILSHSFDTWAPFWFAYAYLTKATRNILLEPKVTELASSVASSVEDDSLYAQLYLRLVAALPMDVKLPARMNEAAASQIKCLVSTARLNSFVTMILSLLVVMTVSVLRPALVAIGTSFFKLITLDEWRSWPIDWASLVGQYKVVFSSLYVSVETWIANGLVNVLDNPLTVAFKVSIFGSLLLATLIPRIEGRREIVLENDDDESEMPTESAEQLSKLGASSASRLTMLSENGSVENVLERWRMARVPSLETTSDVSIASVIRLVGYFLLTGIVTLAPLLVSFFVGGFSNSPLAHTGLQWDSGLDVSVILLYVFFLLYNALRESVLSSNSLPYAKSFLSELSKTLEEMHQSDRQTDLKFMASVSASAGLTVKDLWAAHTSKRAWAVRGASLECRNGEILAVLGDDGSGKTRLLTTIAESLVVPPKRSLTSNKVRGLVTVGGLDASKWDNRLLKRRLGILLSDVRTAGDTATLFSGWTMEEILEPVDGIRASSHALSSSEKSSIVLGLKVRRNQFVTGSHVLVGSAFLSPHFRLLDHGTVYRAHPETPVQVVDCHHCQ
jgi:ABC-type multidrug transport system fused ATPase/permease subunit